MELKIVADSASAAGDGSELFCVLENRGLPKRQNFLKKLGLPVGILRRSSRLVGSVFRDFLTLRKRCKSVRLTLPQDRCGPERLLELVSVVITQRINASALAEDTQRARERGEVSESLKFAFIGHAASGFEIERAGSFSVSW